MSSAFKHAYLILAHTDWTLLRVLVSCLDDVRNDLYIHFDLKVKEIPELIVKNARLTILSNRVDVRWGDESMIEAEYYLFRAALSNGQYAYFHLLSGSDLPIKSQNYIHHFFSEHQGQEFIGYAIRDIDPQIVRKVQRWHLFPRHFKEKGFRRIIRAIFLRLQEMLNIKRNNTIEFKKGAQWVSVTEGMAEYFVNNIGWVRKTFSHTFCSDEMVFHTLCWKSPFRSNIYDYNNEWNGCMRLIGWDNGCLKDWSKKDYDLIAKSDALFARKFNSSDMAFINKIVQLTMI